MNCIVVGVVEGFRVQKELAFGSSPSRTNMSAVVEREY
jgi:hypothetical protein